MFIKVHDLFLARVCFRSGHKLPRIVSCKKLDSGPHDFGGLERDCQRDFPARDESLQGMHDAMRNVMPRDATYKTSTFTVACVPGV